MDRNEAMFVLWLSTTFSLTVGYELVHSSGRPVFRDYVAVGSSQTDSNNKIADH